MDILKNPSIIHQLASRSFFDLGRNNERLDVIVRLNDNPVQKLEEVFNQIISEEKNNNGYYQLQNLFTGAQMVDPDIVINLIVKSISNKIATIKDAIFDSDGSVSSIDLAMYIQAWKNYKDFTQKLYNIIKNYQNYLVERKIKSGKVSHDILSIMQICMLYDSIIDNPSTNILSIVSEELSDIDKKNIDQLIDYIDSIRAFMIMKDFTNIDREKLSNIIKNIMKKTTIVNVMCAHMHNLLRSLTNKQSVIDETEYETVVANNAEKKIIRKIYKIATILSTYADKIKLLACYSKFMQGRIIDLSYDNLEIELELVRRISGLLGKEDSQKLIDTIADIINSKYANQAIHAANIQVKSDEYKKLVAISPNVMNLVVLTKNVWRIYNTSDMEPIYPLELKCYFEIMSKCYASIYDGQYVVNWQPTLGSAQFEALLGSKKVAITCNILQAMALCYINDHIQVTAAQFSNDTLVNLELATKIFESLFEVNLLIYESTNEPVYIVNFQNYTGDCKIDIRRAFVEAFEVETKPDSSKTDNEEMDESIGEDIAEEDSTKEMGFMEFRKTKLQELTKQYPTMDLMERRKKCMEAWRQYQKKNSPTKKLAKSDLVAKPQVDRMERSDNKSSPVSTKTSYQQFIVTKIKELRTSNPGQKNDWYMSNAAKAWIPYKNSINKGALSKEKTQADSSDEELVKPAKKTDKYSSDSDSDSSLSEKEKRPKKYSSKSMTPKYESSSEIEEL